MSADEVLQRLGTYGRHQILLFGMVILLATVNALAPLTVIFTHYEPSYSCVDENQENSSYVQSRNLTSNSTSRQSQDLCDLVGQQQCQHRVYEVELDGGETLVSEFDLVCDKDWVLPMIVSISMAGRSIGIFVGALSDRFGRRPVLLTSSFIAFVATICMAFSRSSVFYGVSLFVTWTSSTVQYISICVMGVETVVPKLRNMVILILQAGYATGYALLPLLAYLSRDWHVLLYITSILSLVYVLGYWHFPETIHWLLSKGRQDAARDLVHKIAARNNVLTVMDEVDELLQNEISSNKLDIEKTGNGPKACEMSLITESKMRTRLIVSTIAWFTTSLVYYAITLNTSYLPGDRYVNCLAAALMELPSYFLAYCLLDRIGRAMTSLVFFAVAGISCLAVPFIESVSPIAGTVSVIVGKTAVSGSFYIIYVHAAEISPTLTRNLYLNICSAFASFGSALAPVLMHIGRTGEAGVYAYVIMGAATILSGLAIVLFLPETMGVPLPDTMKLALQQKTVLQLRVKRQKKKMEEDFSSKKSDSL